jgi:hypothetical protein
MTIAKVEEKEDEDQGPLKSGRGKAVTIKFKNNSDTEVEYFWLNYQGKPVRYGSLKPGQVKS